MASSSNVLEELFIQIKVIGDKAARGTLGRFKKLMKSLVGDIKIFKANLAALAVSGAFRRLGNGVSFLSNQFKELIAGSIQLAGVQEEAVADVAAAMRTAGDFTEQGLADMLAFASSMQDISIHGDELILQQIGIAKSYGASNEQAQQLVQASLELAAAQKRSLPESVRLLSKTLGGYAGELSELIPEVKTFTQEQLQAGAAFQFVGKQFAGSSLKRMKTFNAQLVSLTNTWGDMKELIGAPIIQALIEPIQELKADLKDMAPIFRDFGQKLAGAFKVMKRVFDTFGGNNLIGTALTKFGGFIKTMALLVEDFFLYLNGEDSFIGSKLETKGGISGMLKDLAFKAGQASADVILSVMKGLAVGVGTIIKDATVDMVSESFQFRGLRAALPDFNTGFFDIEKPLPTQGSGGPETMLASTGTGGGTHDNRKTDINQSIVINTSQAGNALFREVDSATKQFETGSGR